MNTTTRTPKQAIWPLIWLGIAIVIVTITGATPSRHSASAINSSAGFTAVEDTFVKESRPRSNFGTKASLEVGGGKSSRRTLTRFQVSGIPSGATVTSATLGLFVTNSSAHSSLAHKVNGQWSENATTWSNAPAVGAPIGSSAGGSRLRSWSQFNVTSAVTGNGTFDFYIVSASKDTAGYAARESSANKPLLHVSWSLPASAPSPTAHPTPKPTASASPTATPVATSTPAPTPASTPAPTATPVPTPVVTAAPTPPPTGAPGPGPSGFVRANGRSLSLAGSTYKFQGVNRYNLLTIDPPGSGNFRGCGSAWSDAELASWFAEIKSQGIDAVRLWAFQRFTASGTDFARMDYLLSLARQYDVRVIPTLENQWQDCTEGGYKRESWYASGYLAPYGAYGMSFKNYVGTIVNRYKNDDRILMWQLMNEAEIKTDSGQCGNPQILKNFATDVSAYIKSIDSNHLVSIGTMGGGQCGAQGGDYQSLHDIPSVDICEFHDYNHPTVPMPGSQWNGLQVRFNQCAALNKPLFMGEAGIKSNCPEADCVTPQQRATLFNAKISAFYNAGGVGYMIWSYRDRDGIDPPWTYDAADPLVNIMASY